VHDFIKEFIFDISIQVAVGLRRFGTIRPKNIKSIKILKMSFYKHHI
jgi:hypothetical protein